MSYFHKWTDIKNKLNNNNIHIEELGILSKYSVNSAGICYHIGDDYLELLHNCHYDRENCSYESGLFKFKQLYIIEQHIYGYVEYPHGKQNIKINIKNIYGFIKIYTHLKKNHIKYVGLRIHDLDIFSEYCNIASYDDVKKKLEKIYDINFYIKEYLIYTLKRLYHSCPLYMINIKKYNYNNCDLYGIIDKIMLDNNVSHREKIILIRIFKNCLK